MKKHVLTFSMMVIFNITQGQMPSFNTISHYAVFARDTIYLSDSLDVNGQAGSTYCNNVSMITPANAYVSDPLILDSARNELIDVISYCNNLTGTPLTGSQINGNTLTEGVYVITGNLILNDIVTLTGNDTSFFIFNISGDLEVQNNASLISAGIKWGRVIFNVAGDISFSGMNFVKGVFIASGNILMNSIHTGKAAYLAVNKIVIQTKITAWSIEKLLAPELLYLYDFGACGLNYTFTDIRLHRRIGGPLNNNLGQLLPANFPPLPLFNGNPIQAFLIYTAVSDAPVPAGHIITLNNITTGAAFNGQSVLVDDMVDPTCWHAFQITATYVANIPPAFITSGATYQLAGIPQIQDVFDPNGAALIVIYQEPCTTEWGYISIDVGIRRAQQVQPIQGFPPLNAMTLEQLTQFTPPTLPVVANSAFMITGDMETQLNNVINVNNNIWVNVNGLMHNFIHINPLPNPGIVQGTNNVPFRIGEISQDCINLSVIGAHYRVNNPAACPLILPTATISGSQTICAGNMAVITITFTGDRPFAYSYTDGSTVFGPITTNQTTVQHNVTPPFNQASGTVVYTLVNVSNHCGTGTVSGSAVITINEPPPAYPITGDVYACTQNAVYCLSGAGPGFTYIWFTNWGASGTGICANFNSPGGNTIPPGGGTITFWIIDNSVTPPCSSQSSLTILPCCPVPQTADDFTYLSSSQVIANVGNFQHATVSTTGELHVQDVNFQSGISGPFPPVLSCPVGVIINGVFMVDVNTRFSRIRVGLGPDAIIRIMPGVTLEMANAWFHACGDYLWNRIELMDPTSGIIIQGSLIEDAKNAVYSEHGGSFRLHNSYFNRNHTSVALSDVVPFGHEVYGCTFTCMDYQIQHTNLLPPHQNRRSLTGYQITKISSLTIGVPGLSPNYFDYLDHGIQAQRSSVSVFNNIFQNITLPAHASSQPASAIHIRGMNPTPVQLIVGGPAPAEGNRFINCGNGIIARNNVNGQIRKNFFQNISNNTGAHSFSVSFAFGSQTQIDIRENEFNGFGFLNNANSGTAVHLYHITNSTVHIIDNIFNNALGSAGNRAIALINMIGNLPSNITFVQGNTMRNMRTGIHLLNYHRAQIGHLNTITLPNALPASGIYYGIRLQNSHRNNIQRNTIRRLNIDPTQAFQTAVFGVSVESSDRNFIHENNIRRTGSGVRFMTTNQNAIHCNELFRNFHGVRLESSNIGDQGIFSSPSSWTAQDNRWFLFSLSNLCIKGVGTFFTTNWYAQQIWPPFLPPTLFIDPQATYFFPPGNPNNCNIAPPRIGRQEEMAAIVTEEGDFNLLTEEERYSLKKAVYIAIYEDSTWYLLGTPYDEILRQFYDSASAGAFGQLMAAQAALLNDTTLASAILSGFNPDNNAEENERTVYEIYLATFAREIYHLTEEQTQILYTIAIQHPVTGGEAVYYARAMLDLFVDDLIEENPQRNIPIDLAGAIRKKCKVYPNPATDKIYFMITLPENDRGIVKVFDITGKTMTSFSLNDGYNFIEASAGTWEPGVYYYTVIHSTNEKQNGKIVIVR